MHQALETFEIVDTIFTCLRDHLPEGYHDDYSHWEDDFISRYCSTSLLVGGTSIDRESSKCTMGLLSSALSCKQLSNLALKHLWWNQRSVQNVLKLLPGYTFDRKEKTIEILGILSEEDWERADMYAKLVRNIVVYKTRSPKIKKSTYRQIQTSRQSRVLFPNLRDIYCQGTWKEVCLLLSPSLRRVVLREGGHRGVPAGRRNDQPPFSSAMFDFVDTLPRICPDIQSLEAYIVLPSATLYSMSKLQRLEHLGLNNVMPESDNSDYMTGISVLSNLRSLRLGARWSPEWPKFMPVFSLPEPFSALRQVEFYGSLESISTCKWLPSFILSNITAITAEMESTWIHEYMLHETTANQLCSKLCDTLVKHACSPSSSLRSVSFIGRLSNDILPGRIDVEAFQPLLALRRLETLVIDIALEGFDDQTLIKWATAWSNLQTFKFDALADHARSNNPVWGNNPTPTLSRYVGPYPTPQLSIAGMDPFFD
ncbi:hypothetical protein M413DRAFT_434933 [Hebeloma cylindrosporum]|uniref:Uncharacterized protein n=1 Tax=Hebeloma cylindrosporum TaxID=76867 RepID=A0A0C2YS70_HEBCY|nr:hypothetical protein M413DRAFT_434933 [Hebeloma cylindrosporum h7]